MPVPTGAVIQDGADVTVSVNLIGRHTLASWPEARAATRGGRRRGVLDNLLEVMDLSQLSESVRNAELADVVVTPRFGPGEWRDFHLADLFLAAGRDAALDQLPALRLAPWRSASRRTRKSENRHPVGLKHCTPLATNRNRRRRS